MCIRDSHRSINKNPSSSFEEFSDGTIIGSLTNPLGPADQEISSLEVKFIFFIDWSGAFPSFCDVLAIQLKVAFNPKFLGLTTANSQHCSLKVSTSLVFFLRSIIDLFSFPSGYLSKSISLKFSSGPTDGKSS